MIHHSQKFNAILAKIIERLGNLGFIQTGTAEMTQGAVHLRIEISAEPKEPGVYIVGYEKDSGERLGCCCFIGADDPDTAINWAISIAAKEFAGPAHCPNHGAMAVV